MKKYMIHILTVLVVLTLAACDFDITNPGGGGRGDGGGRDTVITDSSDCDDKDSTYVRDSMMVDLSVGERMVTNDGKIINVISVEYTERFDPFTGEDMPVVTLEVSVDRGITFETVTLTPVNPVAYVGDCEIRLIHVGMNGSSIRLFVN